MLHTKYTVRNKRPSYAFSDGNAVGLRLLRHSRLHFRHGFRKGDSMSRKAQDLNEAVWLQNRKWNRPSSLRERGSWSVCLDQAWKPVSEDPDSRLPGTDGPFPEETYAVLRVTSQARRQTFKRVHSGGRPRFRIHPGNHLHAGGKPYDRKRGGRS